MTTFEIGSQTAGSIQNVGGDLGIDHLHVDATWSAVEVRHELARVQEQLAKIPLPHTARVAAEGALAAAASEAAAPESDRGRIAQLLERTTHVLGDAGALTTAAPALPRASVVRPSRWGRPARLRSRSSPSSSRFGEPYTFGAWESRTAPRTRSSPGSRFSTAAPAARPCPRSAATPVTCRPAGSGSRTTPASAPTASS